MARLGLDHIYIWVTWPYVERSQGSYAWDELERLVDLSAQYGLDVALDLELWAVPTWAERDEFRQVGLDGQPRPFASSPIHNLYSWRPCLDNLELRALIEPFMLAAVDKFEDKPNLLCWKVWNEPDVDNCACPDTNAKYPEVAGGTFRVSGTSLCIPGTAVQRVAGHQAARRARGYAGQTSLHRVPVLVSHRDSVLGRRDGQGSGPGTSHSHRYAQHWHGPARSARRKDMGRLEHGEGAGHLRRTSPHSGRRASRLAGGVRRASHRPGVQAVGDAGGPTGILGDRGARGNGLDRGFLRSRQARRDALQPLEHDRARRHFRVALAVQARAGRSRGRYLRRRRDGRRLHLPHSRARGLRAGHPPKRASCSWLPGRRPPTTRCCTAPNPVSPCLP